MQSFTKGVLLATVLVVVFQCGLGSVRVPLDQEASEEIKITVETSNATTNETGDERFGWQPFVPPPVAVVAALSNNDNRKTYSDISYSKSAISVVPVPVPHTLPVPVPHPIPVDVHHPVPVDRPVPYSQPVPVVGPSRPYPVPYAVQGPTNNVPVPVPVQKPIGHLVQHNHVLISRLVQQQAILFRRLQQITMQTQSIGQHNTKLTQINNGIDAQTSAIQQQVLQMLNAQQSRLSQEIRATFGVAQTCTPPPPVTIQVPVAQPYEVPKPVPYAVGVPHAVPVLKPYSVPIPHKVPVPHKVPLHYNVPVPVGVPHPVPVGSFLRSEGEESVQNGNAANIGATAGKH